ncbi:MAG: hypothetical protein Q4E70_00585 [Candidatus Saccharibacteria bacterium]|nr:hypothetical protein [Candidatus Saccharibacteria bacterium]
MRKMKGAKKIKRINLSSILGGILILIAIVALSVEVLAKGQNPGGGSGGAGSGGYGTQKCKSGNCWSLRENGAFWLFFPNGTTPSFTYEFSHTPVTACKNGIYILATRLSGGGLAGFVDIDEAISRHGSLTSGDGGSMSGGSVVDPGTAQSQFAANEYTSPGHYTTYGMHYRNTGLSWFCDEYTDTTTTTTTTTATPPMTACSATKYRYLANTESRIAVQNVSLDGRTNRPDINTVRATGVRSSLHTDSGLTMWGDDDVKTIAKPGDSVYFYHCISMTVRYGGWVPNQDVWNSGEQSYSNDYPDGTNHFKIEAFPNSNFLFDEGQISNINSQTASVTALNTALFTSSDPDVSVSPDGYGIDVLAPRHNSSTYNCNQIAWYNSQDPFKIGTFQIPGFKDGSCNSASKVGVSNLVGVEFGQKHTFNSLTVWEKYHHSRGGSCGCGVNSAWATNYGDYNEYPGSFSGTPGKIQLPYQCGPKGTNNCDYYCDNKTCGTYHNECCAAPYYHKYNYPWVDTANNGTGYFMYHKMEKDYGNKTKKATVYTPFNYTTSVESTVDAGDVVFQGGGIDVNYKWFVNPRSNNNTSSFPYATITPDNTEIKLVEFLLKPGYYNVGGNDRSPDDIETYFKNNNVNGVEKFNIIDIKGQQNKEGRYAGSSDGANYTRTIPDNDEYVGYTYCVAMSFYPSDSHNFVTGNAEAQTKRGGGESTPMDAGDLYNISGASCRTIAKKPNFQVWNGSIYTQGEIVTSTSKKMTNSGFGSYSGNSTHIFGSWVDYAIVTGNEYIYGISSGAVLGYNNSRYNLSGGGGVARNGTTYTNINPETISNNGGINYIGNGKVNASASINTNLQRLQSRYQEKAKTFAYDSSEGAYGSQAMINTASTGMQYVYYNGNVNLSNIGIRGSSNPNQTTRREGSNLIKTLGDGKNDNTLVFYINGDLTINQNICLGTGCSDDPTKLSTYNTISTDASAKLPQIIIFANNVYITQEVNRVDAWLIVPNGTIDTCKGFSIGNNLAARDAKQRYDSFGGNCDKTLVVNGPVYASNIFLKRTAGNNHGFAPDDTTTDVLDRSIGNTGNSTDANKGSVAPAEIFNLRADAYIWAYHQAERYSEAVVTYTRELAPRY